MWWSAVGGCDQIDFLMSLIFTESEKLNEHCFLHAFVDNACGEACCTWSWSFQVYLGLILILIKYILILSWYWSSMSKNISFLDGYNIFGTVWPSSVFGRSGRRSSVWPSSTIQWTRSTWISRLRSTWWFLFLRSFRDRTIAIAYFSRSTRSRYFLRIFRDPRESVHVFFAIHAIALFCTLRFKRSYDFAGPGFKPRTMQDLIFMGPGFNSQARMPVSGQVNPWPMSLAPMIGGSGWLAEKIKPQ